MLCIFIVSARAGVKKCCMNGFYNLAQNQCVSGQYEENEIPIHDGINPNQDVEGYNFPNCQGNLEIGIANNQLEIEPEFLLHESQMILIKDHSFHEDFCVDQTEFNNQTVSLYCQQALEIVCQEQLCIRRCCHLGQVCLDYIQSDIGYY